MSVAIIAVIAVLLVLGVGYLIFVLMRKSQTVVPKVTDEDAASRDLVVGVDEQGREIAASQEAPSEPRDDAAFENVLKEELDDLGRTPPAAEEQD